MDVQALSVASTDVRASVVARLLGGDAPPPVDLDGRQSDPDANAARSPDPADGPRTVDRIARDLLRAAREHTADATRTQQFLAGVAFERTTVEAERFEVTVDGDRMSVTVARFRLERTSVAAVAAGRGRVVETDPLLLDLDGDGLETTGLQTTGPTGGSRFDLDADGIADLASLATGGDALLALDRDGDGRIGSGSELFGDHHGARDGIAELARFDEDGNGRIDRDDAVFDRLRLFVGPDQPLRTLADAGIDRIDLTRLELGGTTTGGDRLGDGVAVGFTDGTTTIAGDALLRHA